MRRTRTVCVAFLSIVFLVALVSAVPVDAKDFSKYRLSTDCYVNLPPWTKENPTWIGEVEAEDGEHGAFYWFNHGAYFLPNYDNRKVQKFWGEWWIVWDDGDIIEGTHEGSFTYALDQYTINGRVTKATGDWSHVDGRKIHTIGIVDWTGGLYGIGDSQAIFQIN